MSSGHIDNINKVLEPNSTTKVPQILYDIYQHVYPTLYVIAKAIDAPCPSPGLLSTSARPESSVLQKELNSLQSEQEGNIQEESKGLETDSESHERVPVEEKVETMKES